MFSLYSNMSYRVALITGITGQDGSYLCEFLLEKDYYVYGLIRRASDFNTRRIDHLYGNPRLKLEYGDLGDSGNLLSILGRIKAKHPQMDRLEVYNLAAMSHVKVSFEMPEYTANIDAVGTLRLLEAIRASDLETITRFYQASTSELFGQVAEIPQSEKTPFHPRSPYGVAKLYAHWIVKNYRESYGMFACSGILFNHESVIASSPVLYKVPGTDLIDIRPIEELVIHVCDIGFNRELHSYQQGVPSRDVFIWDGKWVKVTCASGYPNSNKKPKYIISENAAYCTTEEHPIIMGDKSEKETKAIVIGDKVNLVPYPEPETYSDLSEKEAILLGLIVGDGYTFEGNDHALPNFTEWLRSFNFYNDDKTKRIPIQILNASEEIQLAFLRGYNACSHCFENFTTTSATLAAGLTYLISRTTKQRYAINIEEDFGVFSIDLRNNGSIEKTSEPMITQIESNVVKNIITIEDYQGYFYDLETESGTFHTGVGQGHVHNSPRRGPTFVTRKVTMALGNILRGKQERLVLGNLDAKRDWGHAKDYIRAMWMMLQGEQPEDYVVSSNETHTVREFIERVFALKGFQIHWKGSGIDEIGYDAISGRELIFISPEYFRPAEVDLLHGDSTKIREKLGWRPQYSFQDLIEEMVAADCE